MNPNKRLLSLDVLRGITVAGMILVNNTGKCGYNFAAFATCQVGWLFAGRSGISDVYVPDGYFDLHLFV